MAPGLVETTPLDEHELYSLYLGGLALGEEEFRLKAAYVVLLAGRLGLRPDEIRHLHEGWIDWRRGQIRIPRHDPCACETCWERARSNRGMSHRSLSEIVYEEAWSPPAETGARSIPFGHAERLVAVLASFLDKEEYLAMDVEEIERLLAAAAENTNGIDPTSVTPEALRASAATFFADAGLDARTLAGVLGLDVETATTFLRRGGGRARVELADAFGDPERAVDPESYRLLSDPTPFEREPFDPRAFDEETRRRLDENHDATDRIGTPRPPSPPEEVEYDPGRHRFPGHAEPESDAVSRREDGVPSRFVLLRRWIRLHEKERRIDAGTTDDAVPSTSTAEGQTTPSEPASTDARPTDEPDATPRADTAAASSDGDGTGGNPPATTSGSGGDRSAATVDPEDASEFRSPRDRVTDPIAVEVSTGFAVSDVASGSPRTGRVFLGQSELLFDPEEGEPFLLDLDRVADVAIDYAPSAVENAFDSPVGIAYRSGDDRRVAVVDLPGTKQWAFSTALFERVLDDEDVFVTHPAREGGRVTDASPRPFTLSVAAERLTLDAVEEDDEVEIRLSDVIDVERDHHDVDGERRRGLRVTHLSGPETLTTTISASNPARKLLERFLRLEYRQREEKLRSISLSASEKELLVALYQTDDAVGLPAVIDRSPEEIEAAIDSLEEHGLVRDDEGTTLTGTGRMAVADKIDDVNV